MPERPSHPIEISQESGPNSGEVPVQWQPHYETDRVPAGWYKEPFAPDAYAAEIAPLDAQIAGREHQASLEAEERKEEYDEALKEGVRAVTGIGLAEIIANEKNEREAIEQNIQGKANESAAKETARLDELRDEIDNTTSSILQSAEAKRNEREEISLLTEVFRDLASTGDEEAIRTANEIIRKHRGDPRLQREALQMVEEGLGRIKDQHRAANMFSFIELLRAQNPGLKPAEVADPLISIDLPYEQGLGDSPDNFLEKV